MIQIPHDQVVSIVAAVAAYYGLSREELIAPGRQKLLVEARQICVQLLSEYGAGTSVAGRAIGRDHSTAQHALRRNERHMPPERWEALQDCRQAVRGCLVTRATEATR